MKDEKSKNQLEAAVLKAAEDLGAQLDTEVEGIEAYNIALAKKTDLEQQLSVAEEELVDADLEYGQAKKSHLTAKREKEALHEEYREVLRAVDEARENIWRLSRSKDTEAILSAARDLAEKNLACWEVGRRVRDLEEEVHASESRMRDASEKRKTAVQKRGRLKARVEEAAREMGEAIVFYKGNLFELEKALVNAACALNGSDDKQFAYSYAHTHDLFDLKCDDGCRPY